MTPRIHCAQCGQAWYEGQTPLCQHMNAEASLEAETPSPLPSPIDPKSGDGVEREPIVHDVKCAAPFFDGVWSGDKTFEVRKDDRDYQTGDSINQHEWDAVDGYSGRVTGHDIGFVLRGYPHVQEGYAVFSLIGCRRLAKAVTK